MVTPAHCPNYFKKSPFFLPGFPRCTLRRAFRAGLGRSSARLAVGIPFCAVKDTFFCHELPRSTFRAGFGSFFCPAGGWYLLPRRK